MLRIAVGDKLALPRRAILHVTEAIAVGGCIAVELYQSLRDKIVKREMVKGVTSLTPASLPAKLDDRTPYLRLLTRGAVKADATELQVNPHSASVRLRAAKRLCETPHTA